MKLNNFNLQIHFKIKIIIHYFKNLNKMSSYNKKILICLMIQYLNKF